MLAVLAALAATLIVMAIAAFGLSFLNVRIGGRPILYDGGVALLLFFLIGAGVAEIAARGDNSYIVNEGFSRLGLPYDSAYCPPDRLDCIRARLIAEGKWRPGG